jgi:hypothetical protein
MSDFKFSLGDSVRDLATGFSGVVVSRTEWIGGDRNYGVQQNTANGYPVKVEVLGERRLERACEPQPQQCCACPNVHMRVRSCHA